MLRQPREVQAQTHYEGSLLPDSVYETRVPGALQQGRPAAVEADW